MIIHTNNDINSNAVSWSWSFLYSSVLVWTLKKTLLFSNRGQKHSVCSASSTLYCSYMVEKCRCENEKWLWAKKLNICHCFNSKC